MCQNVPKKNHQIMLDPAFLEYEQGGVGLVGYSKYIASTDGVSLEWASEFVLKDKDILIELLDRFNYIFFLMSRESYFVDMPVFSEKDWDPTFSSGDLINIGWTIYAYSEPAILYGYYPVLMSGIRDSSDLFCPHSKVAVDDCFVNNWGLIRSMELAEQIARVNNSVEHENRLHWEVLGVFLHPNSYLKLLKELLDK